MLVLNLWRLTLFLLKYMQPGGAVARWLSPIVKWPFPSSLQSPVGESAGSAAVQAHCRYGAQWVYNRYVGRELAQREARGRIATHKSTSTKVCSAWHAVSSRIAVHPAVAVQLPVVINE
jgi:hypothetical protein